MHRDRHSWLTEFLPPQSLGRWRPYDGPLRLPWPATRHLRGLAVYLRDRPTTIVGHYPIMSPHDLMPSQYSVGRTRSLSLSLHWFPLPRRTSIMDFHSHSDINLRICGMSDGRCWCVMPLTGTSSRSSCDAGFKAKWTASLLVLILSVFNVFMNNWWSVHASHPQRDFLKFVFAAADR